MATKFLLFVRGFVFFPEHTPFERIVLTTGEGKLEPPLAAGYVCKNGRTNLDFCGRSEVLGLDATKAVEDWQVMGLSLRRKHIQQRCYPDNQSVAFLPIASRCDVGDFGLAGVRTHPSIQRWEFYLWLRQLA